MGRSTTNIKKQISSYFKSYFTCIKHPFSSKILELRVGEIDSATHTFFQILETPIKDKRIEGLDTRFYESFVSYFSVNRLNKAEFINSFSSLIRLYEPLVKKIAVIKNNDNSLLNSSLNQSLIEKVCGFDAKINENKKAYWKTKSVKEASIRYVYPYRHIEAHEARDYSIFEIEQVIYYMFSSLIFMCAPKLIKLEIRPDKIRWVKGLKERGLFNIQSYTGAKVEIDRDGTVVICSPSTEAAENAKTLIQRVTEEVTIGKIYKAKVLSIKNYGVFIEIIPGHDGLVHISELCDNDIERIEDVLKVGEEIWVKVIGIDDQRRVKLSRKAALNEMRAKPTSYKEAVDDDLSRKLAFNVVRGKKSV